MKESRGTHHIQYVITTHKPLTVAFASSSFESIECNEHTWKFARSRQTSKAPALASWFYLILRMLRIWSALGLVAAMQPVWPPATWLPRGADISQWAQRLSPSFGMCRRPPGIASFPQRVTEDELTGCKVSSYNLQEFRTKLYGDGERFAKEVFQNLRNKSSWPANLKG